MKRLRILVSAYACSPYLGSEPGVGWGWVNALSQYHDLWVITEQHEFKASLERKLAEQPQLSERVRFHYIPIHDQLIEHPFGPRFYHTYKKWQKKAYELALRLHAQNNFDFVHQLNMVGFREPGYLWKLNAPFVWGPVGGTDNAPLRFASVLGVRGFAIHLARSLVNGMQLRYSSRVRKALARASGFVTATSGARQAFLAIHNKDSAVISQNAINNVLPGRTVKTNSPLRLNYTGKHVSRKGLPIALRALALVPRNLRWHFDIVGIGPETGLWRRLANDLGIEQNCTWHGWLHTKADSEAMMEKADVFLFPSLLDAMPTAVLEALSRAIPVICLDLSGVADAITQDCGIKIPATNTATAVQGFADAIAKLASNPIELERLSQGAHRRAQDFTWPRICRQMLDVYEKVFTGSPSSGGEQPHQKISCGNIH